MVGLDHRIQRWVVEHRVSWLDQVFVWLSRLGAFGWVFLVIALAAAIVLRRPRVFVLTLAAAVVGDLLARGLQAAIGRQRPPVLPGEPHRLVSLPSSESFPSGHATVAFACAVTLALAVPRLAVPVLVLAAAIAYSRVYVGVHYPLDVIAGAVLGTLIAIALRRLAAALTRSRRSPTPG